MAEIEPAQLLFVGPIGPDGVREETKPYLIEIGLIALAWNDLQEKLGELFWRVTNISNGLLAFGIWHTLRDDRMQRRVLRAAAAHGLNEWPASIGPKGQGWVKKGNVKINWLLTEVDQLAERRNDYLHAPIMFNVPQGSTPQPMTFFGNPRARALTGRHFLNEIQRDRENIATLSTYAVALKFHINALRKSHEPWPHKPHLLSAEEFLRRKEKETRRSYWLARQQSRLEASQK